MEIFKLLSIGINKTRLYIDNLQIGDSEITTNILIPILTLPEQIHRIPFSHYPA